MPASTLGFFNSARGVWVARSVEKADTFRARLVGLLGRKGLAEDAGLWIVPCSSVHSFFMAFVIDVVFLDRGFKVLAVCRLPPWRMSPWVPGAHSVLELPVGASARLAPGETLEIR